MVYTPDEDRYEKMTYNYCGDSGLKLPAISLGMWHNFGGIDNFEVSRAIIRRAFDLGITHFDLANNYGQPPGSAEETLGKILTTDLASYRDQLIISTKAGYGMWPGPYGDGGSRKYLLSSLNQSLERLGVEYVDIFYHHRPDPKTPLEETMQALDAAVRQGKALYVGISNYGAEQTEKAAEILKDLGTPFITHQPSYSMFNRWIEDGLTDVLKKEQLGAIVFSPLHQGLLTDKYLDSIPDDSRAASSNQFLNRDDITKEKLTKIRQLNKLVQNRGQTLAQMALAWVLNLDCVGSALVGASRVSQIEENVETLENLNFTQQELDKIDEIL